MVVQCSQMFANIKHSMTVFNEHLFYVCEDSSKSEKRLCLAWHEIKRDGITSFLGFMKVVVKYTHLSSWSRLRLTVGLLQAMTRTAMGTVFGSTGSWGGTCAITSLAAFEPPPSCPNSANETINISMRLPP